MLHEATARLLSLITPRFTALRCDLPSSPPPRLINRWKLNGTSVRASFLPDHSNISIARPYLASLFIRSGIVARRRDPSLFQASRKPQRQVSLYVRYTCKCIFSDSRRNIPTLHRSFCLSVTENNDDRIGCIAAGGDTRDTTSSSTP